MGSRGGFRKGSRLGSDEVTNRCSKGGQMKLQKGIEMRFQKGAEMGSRRKS